MVAPFEEAPALQAPSGSATDGAAAADGADVPELVFAPAEPALEPTSAAEPREIVLPTTHVVARNDTLYKLAARYYGKRSEWTRILAANPQLGKDGTHLALGMELTIPKY
jgi:5'-nucleotidase